MYQRILYLIFILIIPLNSQTIANNFQDACSGVTLDNIFLSDSQKINQRNSIRNYFTSQYQKVINYYKNGQTNQIISSAAPFVALLIILMIITLITFVIFCIFCLGKFKQPESSIKKREILIISLIALLVFIVLLIIYLVYIGLMNKDYKNSRCGIYLVPQSLLNGVNEQKSKFIGISGINSVFAQLDNEIPNLSTGKDVFQKLFNEDISSPSNAAVQSTVFFANKFSNEQTFDPSGKLKKPFSILKLNEGINAKVGTEFDNIDDIGHNLDIASQSGLEISNDTQSYKTKVQQFRLNSDQMNSQLSTFFDQFTREANLALDYGKGGYIANLVLILIAFILLCVLLVILFCMTKSRECFYCKRCVKIILVLFTLLILGAFIASFFIMISSSSVSGFCKLLGDFNSQRMPILKKLQQPLDQKIYDVFKNCYDKQGNGELFQIYSDNSIDSQQKFKNINNLVNGISTYNLAFKDNAVLKTQALEDYAFELEQIKKGDIEDHFKTKTTLQELNDQISCSGDKFKLNAAQCKEIRCLGLYDTQTYTVPSCVPDKNKVELLFKNFREYFRTENELISKMRENLLVTADSPKIKYDEAKRVLEAQKTPVQQLGALMPNTFQQFNSYETNFKSVTNCRNLSIQTHQLENHLCFKFSKNLYIVFILSFICPLILLITSWIICCGFRGEQQSADRDKIYIDDTQDSIQQIENFQMTNFEDDEKAPVF